MSTSQRALIAFAVLFSAGSLLASGAAQAASGKQLFESRCSVCHKKTGEGGMKFGKAVSADLRSPGLEDTYHHSEALLLRAIMNGEDENGKPLDPPMPHWRSKLSKQQGEAIISYLETLCCSATPEKTAQ